MTATQTPARAAGHQTPPSPATHLPCVRYPQAFELQRATSPEGDTWRYASDAEVRYAQNLCWNHCPMRSWCDTLAPEPHTIMHGGLLYGSNGDAHVTRAEYIARTSKPERSGAGVCAHCDAPLPNGAAGNRKYCTEACRAAVKNQQKGSRRADERKPDTSIVEKLVAGQAVKTHTLAERRLAVMRLHTEGLNDQEIARRIGRDPATVRRIRLRLGLPSNHHVDSDVVDHAAVERAASGAGDLPTLTPTERAHAIALMRRRGMTFTAIARRLSLSLERVRQVNASRGEVLSA